MPLKVRKRDGVYYVVGQLDGHRYNRSSRSARKEDAEALRSRLEAEARHRRLHGEPSELTFNQATAIYVNDGGSTRFIAPLVKHFGEKRVKSISGLDARAAAKKLYPSAGPATWNRQVITPMRAIINRCAESGLCSPIKVRQFRKDDKDVNRPAEEYQAQAIDRAWLDKFRAACNSPYLAALALFMFQTGWRIGEAVELTPRDIDLAGRRVWLGSSKNGDAIEGFITVEMMVELANLPPRRAGEDQIEKLFGFASRHAVYGVWKRTCARAGLSYVPPHQAGRHSFATEMIERHGKSIAATAKAGHWKSHRLLSEVYTHPEELRGAIDDVFGAGDLASTAQKPHQRKSKGSI
jgi:integrase